MRGGLRDDVEGKGGESCRRRRRRRGKSKSKGREGRVRGEGELMHETKERVKKAEEKEEER